MLTGPASYSSTSLMDRFGIKELTRTGKVALPRSND